MTWLLDSATAYSVVVPTIGRGSLTALLDALAEQDGPAPAEVVLVDDHPTAVRGPIPLPVPDRLRDRCPVTVLPGGGRGPATARNVGWRHAGTPWIAFLDDDVVPSPSWSRQLAADLDALGPDDAGSQGRVVVPLPARRPTDAERGTAGLATAAWATADLAYRRVALESVGGFDERFPRAYREDADIALRLLDLGWRLTRGQRTVEHPPRPESFWASVRAQAGNADDALMRRLHGPGWQQRAQAPRGRRLKHIGVTLAGLTALGLAPRRIRAIAAALWLAGTAELALARVLPGPADLAEMGRMLVTSAAIPPVATWYAALGTRRWRHAGPWHRLPRAVLFDRDGTLVVDVPYNGNPELVEPMPGARAAVSRLRAAGIRLGVISNQSGVARGLITADQVDAVNRRVAELLGPFNVWAICPHDDNDGCRCRKPAPGLVLQAAGRLGLSPSSIAVVGDIGRDVDAAQAAGARPVLVPTAVTKPDEIDAAPLVVPDLAAAVDALIGRRP